MQPQTIKLNYTVDSNETIIFDIDIRVFQWIEEKERWQFNLYKFSNRTLLLSSIIEIEGTFKIRNPKTGNVGVVAKDIEGWWIVYPQVGTSWNRWKVDMITKDPKCVTNNQNGVVNSGAVV